MEKLLKPHISPNDLFGDTDALRLHQLRLLEWMNTADQKRPMDQEQQVPPGDPVGIPEVWKLTKGVEPLPWQRQCMAKWQEKKGHGTVKVVTGAGKTMLALFMAELVQNTEDKDLRLAIIVPTIVLMDQWYDVMLKHGNIPVEAIGRL